VKPESFSYQLLTIVLRLALILALFFCGWSIYRRMPGAPPSATHAGDDAGGGEQTTLSITLHVGDDGQGTGLDIPVELYPVDVAAAQREFLSERRAGIRFDDFLEKRLDGRNIFKARLDNNGGATLLVPEGTWWLYATLPGPVTTEWRLPLNVAGRRQSVALTSANVYSRSREF
jgi:hypothetical protein